MGSMMRIGAAAISIGLAAALLLPTSAPRAQTAPSSNAQVAQNSPAVEPSATPRRRPLLRRVPIYPRYQGEPDGVYPRYFPGPNAVRDCTATYVQEFRPSGTVIVPRMNCVWRPG
jgi:hypothetical protein